jgi:tagatose-6-phosphate ketose/aldose isomerase
MTTSADPGQWATWREIHAQPDIWRHWGAEFDAAALCGWIAGLGVEEVWFCGSGTSAFIGDILVAGLEGQSTPRLRAVPATDLVSRPQAFLNGVRPLVVSFGRSGNSSETIGTLDALDALAPGAPRLNITCNATSALATRKGRGAERVIILPEATHDAGFAMTSSFSTMLLSALAVFEVPARPDGPWRRAAASIETALPQFRAALPPRPERAVFLGTGALSFAAREAALKVLELTAGRTPALWDSTLGFRHGPKSFVTDGTDITLFLSDGAAERRYELDLLAELRAQFPNAAVRGVGPGGDIEVAMPDGPVWAAPVLIGFAQVAGALWSAELGLDVDDPFAGQGTLSRVVSGVTLYPVSS